MPVYNGVSYTVVRDPIWIFYLNTSRNGVNSEREIATTLTRLDICSSYKHLEAQNRTDWYWISVGARAGFTFSRVRRMLEEEFYARLNTPGV